MTMACITKHKASNGKTTYRARVRISGVPSCHNTFDKMGEARTWANMQESEIRSGKHQTNALAKKYTVGDMIQRYLDKVIETKSRSKRYIQCQKAQLYWWKKEIGSYILILATPYVLAECRDKLLKQVSPATANRYFAALSHVINTAIKEWGWLEINPITKVKKPKEPRGRVRFLSENERDALLAACKQETVKPLYLIVVMAITTGARKMELLSIKWEDMDLERGMVTVHDTKNHERRSLFVVGYARELMQLHADMVQLKRGYVFPSRNKKQPLNIDNEWKEAVKSAGLKDFRFHDLRHTTASYLAMCGKSITEIAEVLGHKTLNMVKRYAHLSKTHTATAVEEMAEKFMNGRADGKMF